jgi:hypothetical protein
MGSVPPVGGSHTPPSYPPPLFFYTPDVAKTYFDFLSQVQNAPNLDPKLQSYIKTVFNMPDPITGKSLYGDYQAGSYDQLARTLNQQGGPMDPLLLPPLPCSASLAQSCFAFLTTVDQSYAPMDPEFKEGIDSLFAAPSDPFNPSSPTFLQLYQEGDYQGLADALNKLPPQPFPPPQPPSF